LGKKLQSRRALPVGRRCPRRRGREATLSSAGCRAAGRHCRSSGCGRAYDIACGQIDIGNAVTDMAARMATGVKQADGRIAAEAMLDVERVADAVVQMASLPLEANVQFMTIMATKMPFVGRG
jgi:NADP-dependent 3-hydroxy acid dehydrogenase YdfG